jgi:hypothetical protein
VIKYEQGRHNYKLEWEMELEWRMAAEAEVADLKARNADLEEQVSYRREQIKKLDLEVKRLNPPNPLEGMTGSYDGTPETV